MRVVTVLAAVLMLGVVRVVPVAAQIDPIGAVNGSLSAAQQAGVAITALVVLVVSVVVGGGVGWLWYRDRQATRTDRREERKLTREAMTEASTVNKLLMDRLDTLTKTHQIGSENTGAQTEAIGKLMAAIDESENTRSERYQRLFERQEGVEKGAQRVADELQQVKQSVDKLAVKIDEHQALTEGDRETIRTLTDKVDALLHKLEGDGHETGDGDSGAGPAAGGADAASGGASDGVSDQHDGPAGDGGAAAG